MDAALHAERSRHEVPAGLLRSGVLPAPARDAGRDRLSAAKSLHELGVTGVVLDIEGTTTPISFVYDVLFPYARAHLREHLMALSSGEEQWVSADVARYEQLMEEDSKDTELKRIQGEIWKAGYENGTLRGEIFPDVPGALRRWRGGGTTIAIYSSGSILAQKLLFGNTTLGDYTPFISHWFDTGVGPKRESASYTRIAESMKRRPMELLFLSDVSAELSAARAAGLQTRLVVRLGNAEREAAGFKAIGSFDDLT